MMEHEFRIALMSILPHNSETRCHHTLVNKSINALIIHVFFSSIYHYYTEQHTTPWCKRLKLVIGWGGLNPYCTSSLQGFEVRADYELMSEDETTVFGMWCKCDDIDYDSIMIELLTDLKFSDLRAEFDHSAGRLVTEYHRWCHNEVSNCSLCVIRHVRSTYTCSLYSYLYFYMRADNY